MTKVHDVLIGCEESQKVCRAFRELGFNAFSCDLQPTRGNEDWHMQKCVMDAIVENNWDAIILHPCCRAMALAGNGTYGKGKPKHRERVDALKWTLKLWKLATKNCRHVVLENPKSVVFPHLRRLGAKIHYIQPWEHGHPETKETGLAYYGLEPIRPTNDVSEQMKSLTPYQRHRIWYMGSKNKNRSRERSETYQGIAMALAKQVGDQL